MGGGGGGRRRQKEKGRRGKKDIARWREIYKATEQKVREDMKWRNGENRTSAKPRHLWQKGKNLISTTF